MEWEQCMKQEGLSVNEIRNTSLIDIDKIVFSSKFRTLQDKTQVYPLSKGNVVRTRLTHSLEVSSVGRSLGFLIGNHVIKNNNLSTDFKNIVSANDFANHVAAACMIHDIGNPPFGHAGEDAISEFFKVFFEDKENRKGLSKEQQNDFIKFNGNAQGFLLTSGKWQKGNLSVSKPTLGAFVKYPCTSSKNDAYGNKYCLNQKSLEDYKELADTLGIPKLKNNVWARHPLVFLTEAADDICYCVADIEDGVLLGDIRYDIAQEQFLNIATKDSGFNLKQFNDIDVEDTQRKLSYLRGRIINYLIFEVQRIFVENEEKILKGSFCDSKGQYVALLDLLQQDDRKTFKEFKTISQKYLFREAEKLSLEIKGTNAIKLIVKEIINALKNKDKRTSKLILAYTKQKDLIDLEDYEINKYEALLKVTGYISLLTDHNLMEIASKIENIKKID